jgi:hypothetical protein
MITSDNRQPNARRQRWIAGFGALILAASACWLHAQEKSAARISPDPDVSRAAFLKAYKVFMSPRCMNCHPNGDVPLQGEDSHLHLPIVKRGEHGRGMYALKCANCHQDTNLDGAHLPPGNPNWSLPPPEFPMVFEGRTPAQLARQMLDPKQNGNKTLEQLIHHAEEEPLVLTCWTPNSNGRPLPPMSHAEFAKAVRDWLEKGAAIPDESLPALQNKGH